MTTTTFGRYRLLERLGQGGMAEVFKAKSYGVEGFEKVLVIKRILPDLARSQEFVDMFIHEAKLAVRLSHANIVQVFDLGLAPGPEIIGAEGHLKNDAYFMAMEYVHGFDLATLLSRCRRQQVTLPIDMCVYVASEIAKGLDHAHRRRDEQMRPLGIVHRDVSPQNVLLSLEGEVKVTDFGIAKARGVLDSSSGEDTRTRQLHGKFGYMSPEQARGEAVDARSDLFSLGVLVYECVAGVNPFSAPTTFETLRRVQANEYPPIELLRPDAPAELVAMIKMAMGKEPSDRYPDAGRMYEAMLAFLYSQGSRYGGHDLAEFLFRFRGEEAPSATLPDRVLEGEVAVSSTAERTPVEIPGSRISALPTPSTRMETGVRFVGIDLAAERGERREVTALVIDFPQRDSGALAGRVAQIVTRYGGRVVTKEPEHLAALFGLGEPDGRDTEVAIRCALVTLRSLGVERPPSAGIHTSRIHVTHALTTEPAEGAEPGGRSEPAESEATEDERLRGLLQTAREFSRASSGKVAISAAAMRQVKGLFELDPLSEGDQPRTGLTGSIVRDVRGPAETFGRFVGRKDELRRLGEVLATATKRHARALTIRGDHGVGKTRLLFETERRLQKGGYNVGFYIATCPPRGRELPLSGIVCMLQVLCGVNEGDSPERILAVQPRLRALGLHDEDVAAILNALGASVPASNSNAKTALKHAFTRMVASLCDDKPYTFAWDVAHSMDEDSYAVLEVAFERLPQARMVFAFATRAGFSHPLERAGNHTVLELADLAAEDAERLIAARLGVEAAPDELLRFVRERAGGHPQFIEEVLKALVDAQAVTIAERKVVSMKLVGQELALPKTLRGLVASRVARLSPAERASLQAAAIIGDPVDTTVLARMRGMPMSALEGSIAALESRELLVHTGPSELRFTSPIIREVVVDALTHEVTRQMHAVAGLAFEEVLGDKAWEHAARIAPHFYEAGDRNRAATYFAKSGERRLEARQMEAAARDYARAIDLVEVDTRDPEELAGWLRSLADAVRLVRACPEAAEISDRVLARVDAAGDDGLRVRTRVAAGLMLAALHRFDLARAHFAAAEVVAEGNESLAKRVLQAYAELGVRQGDFNRALAMLQRLQKIVTDEGDKLQEHKILLHTAQAHAGLGDKRSALVALSRAEQVLPTDAAAACERQKVRSLIDYFSRDFRSAVLASEKAVDMARALAVPYEVAINLHNLGDFLVRLEDFPRAYGAIRQSIELCDEQGFERLASQNRMFLAFLDGAVGDSQAESLLRQGVRYAEAHDYTWDAINGRVLLAQLLQRRGEVEVARAEFQKANVAARESGNRLLADDCDAALRAMAS
jgi:serine/threonine protein kinase/tetratricopeptide (TPR) repeat protein